MTSPNGNGHDREKSKPETLDRPVQFESKPHMIRPSANVTVYGLTGGAQLSSVRAWRWTPGDVSPHVEPTLVGYGNALLAVLPDPLKLRHGPLLVSVERWSDGNVVARLPAARLHASGRTEAEAMSELAADIAKIVQDLTEGPHASTPLGGAMLDTWRALTVFVDAPGLDKPRT